MSYYKTYSCGCNPCKSNNTTCCQYPVQPAPSPCCESHDVKYVHKICLYTACKVTAVEGTFYLTFSNDCGDSVPMNGSEVYFYHAVAGLMKVNEFTGTSYGVTLVDDSRAGAVIETTDCILVQVIPNSIINPTSGFRCLSGNFVAPALNSTQTIYIENGTGVPIGSTITFLDNDGNAGSYIVTAFISSSDNIYAYTVENAGGGHTPGTLIEGGPAGVCNISIEVITDIDVCDLTESTTADSLTACLGGSPRAFVPEGDGYVPIGTSGGEVWGQQKLTGLDCCITILGCLKFSGATCPTATDQVEISPTNIECFVEAYEAAMVVDQVLPATIDGFPIVITNYDSGTNVITVANAEDETLPSLVEFPEGSQICLGECCYTCTEGPQLTDPQINSSDIEETSVFSFTPNITVPVGTSYWLVGSDNTTGATTTLELTAPYFAAPSGLGPELPKIADPMILRQKICNTSPEGCNQFVQLQFNYQIAIANMPADMFVDWELGHYAQESATLSDNTTVNPFFNVFTQQKASGRLEGPSVTDATLLVTSFGLGGVGVAKTFPLDSNDFRDLFPLAKCDCALSMVWCFLRFEAGTETEVTVKVGFRRHLLKFDDNRYPNPINNPASESFNS